MPATEDGVSGTAETGASGTTRRIAASCMTSWNGPTSTATSLRGRDLWIGPVDGRGFLARLISLVGRAGASSSSIGSPAAASQAITGRVRCGWSMYSRTRPSRATRPARTIPPSRSSRRCRLVAARLIPSASAIDEARLGRSASMPTMALLVGSVSRSRSARSSPISPPSPTRSAHGSFGAAKPDPAEP